MKRIILIIILFFSSLIHSQNVDIKSLLIGNKWVYHETGWAHGGGGWKSNIVEEVMNHTLINGTKYAKIKRLVVGNNDMFGEFSGVEYFYERADTSKLFEYYFCGRGNVNNQIEEIIYDFSQPINDSIYVETGYIVNIAFVDTVLWGMEKKYLFYQQQNCQSGLNTFYVSVLPQIGVLHKNSNFVDNYYHRNLLGAVIEGELFGDTTITNIANYEVIPDKFYLFQNFPNPFNPSTHIMFELHKKEFVSLKIFSVLGKEITTLVKKELDAGTHRYEFSSTNLSSGIYFYRVDTGNYSETKKMVLLR